MAAAAEARETIAETEAAHLFGEIQTLKISDNNACAQYEPPGTNASSDKSERYSNTNEHLTHFSDTRQQMLSRVANSDAHFKHQQLGEPDLTYADKLTIAADILDKKPATFLERFGKELVASDLSYFDRFRDDYCVEFYFREITKRLAGSWRNSEKRIRNRRYSAMKRLEAQGEYFGDEEMKQRDPLLYEDLIGRHLTNEEVAAMADRSGAEGSLSALLLRHLQATQNNERYRQQRDLEDGQVEEEDEEEEDENFKTAEEIGDDGAEAGLSAAERAALRAEFVATMQERFLKGEDPLFDYGAVDNNSDYDATDMLNLDAEEMYFAGEDADELCTGKDADELCTSDDADELYTGRDTNKLRAGRDTDELCTGEDADKLCTGEIASLSSDDMQTS